MVSLEDRQIIDLFYARSEQAIVEPDQNDTPDGEAFVHLGARKCILPAGHLHRLKKSVKWCQTKEKAR